MDPRSPSDTTPSGVNDLAARVPELTPVEWGRIGGGAALALLGTGLVSLGTLVRLAAVLGGGAVVYQTLKSGSAPGKAAERAETGWSARSSWQEAAPAHDADADGATMEGSDPAPASRSRAT